MKSWSLNGPDQDLFTKSQVVAYLGLTNDRALDRLITSGLFPRGAPLAGKRSGLRWTGLDIAVFLYMRSRISEGATEPDQEDERMAAEEES